MSSAAGVFHFGTLLAALLAIATARRPRTWFASRLVGTGSRSVLIVPIVPIGVNRNIMKLGLTCNWSSWNY